MDKKIKNILIRNSDLLKKNKINFIKLFNNYQTGGGKDLSVSYNDKKYIFIKSEDIDDHYVLFSKDVDECVYIIISQEDKTAEIHGIGESQTKFDLGSERTTRLLTLLKSAPQGKAGSYSSCLQETNQNVGSTLLKITLKLLKKYKEKFQIKMVILTDNSVKKCYEVDIKLSIMMTLLTGDTWYGRCCKNNTCPKHKNSKNSCLYGRYGFRPIKITGNSYSFDEIEVSKYKKNKKIMNTIKISDINLIKYIKKTNNSHIINATEQIIKTSPNMLLKDFLSNLLKSYDKTCQYFSMFYEELYNKIRVYEPHRQFYGLIL
jgi:hypothetical protein